MTGGEGQSVIQASLEAVLRDPQGGLPADDQGAHCVFAVREGPTVFYVSEGNIRRRLWEHLGVHGQWSSLLGNVIINNLPHSLQWVVDMWTLEECTPWLRAGEPVTPATAKAALIRQLQPCLNRVEDNPNPTPLPPVYEHSIGHNPAQAERLQTFGLVHE